MEYQVVFESENILFVKLNEKLIDDYLVMVNDPEVASKISHKVHTYTYEEELDWLNLKLQEKALCYSMIEKQTGDFIGNIEIMKIDNNIGELGITITPKKQNLYYGTESIKALLKYAFDKLHLNGMKLDVFRTNLRAIHCYEKVGFIVDGKGKTNEDIHMVIYKK